MASTVVKGRTHRIVADLTTADINAGITILLGQPGQTVTVTGAKITPTLTPATATGIYLEDGASSPVIVGEFLVGASLVDATELVAAKAASGFTAGAGWQVPLTGGKGLKVVKHGSSITTMTSAKLVIDYFTTG